MHRHIVLAAYLAMILGCSTGAQTVLLDASSQPDGHQVADQNGPADAGSDLAPAKDNVSPADQFDLLFADSSDTSSLGCLPGEGCFLDKCDENDDCLSGWCVEYLGEGVCSQTCQAECPDGWECQQVAGTIPDVVYICVSNHANLCRPCASGNDCKSIGGAEDVCVDYGDAGSFCGGTCGTDDDCPWGFSCVDGLTVDGFDSRQCVADAGECPCTAKSAALALWTPCSLANEFGECSGKRVCTDAGLADCDAGVPAPEVCNGLDDDCDGELDEETCDDDNDCTEDTCLGESACQNLPLDLGECKDGNPCTVADHCTAGVCVGDPVLCDDQNPCTEDLCTEQGGCQHLPAAGDCDDADACTLGDHCSNGACVGEPVDCDCLTDSDCDALEDGDFCTGTLYCDQSKVPFTCRTKAESIVVCPQPEGPDAPCLTATCNPGNGTCSLVPSGDGQPCDDGNSCSLGDLCSQGQCAAGPMANCNDGNPCTNDSCDPAMGCIHTDNQAPCSDGNVCTTADQCDNGECLPGPLLSCNDDNGCTDDTCDPAIGCSHINNVAPCDDGNACTGNDSCSGGSCKGGTDVDCNDANPCTADSCSPANGCVYQLLTSACDDGDNCTGPDLCKLGECVGQALDCDDNNPCTDELCQPGVGCVFTNNQAACDDGNQCTLNDTCNAGTCQGGPLLNCNDDNVCTTDTCGPATGCIYTFNDAPCTDGDICTIEDQCSLGECVGSGQLTCNDANPCTDDGCQPDVGCQFVPNQAPCDDGNACTDGDTCLQGSCKAGAAIDCNDQNLCTDDSCHAETGCMHVDNALPCSDNNACTLNDVCAGGTCTGGPALNCDDNNLCTNDDCQPANGCVYQFNVEPCNDNNPCTTTDACANGSCQGSGDLDCDDQNACTDDSCATGEGCLHTLTVNYLTDDNNCGSCGNACEPDEDCVAGDCQLNDPWVGAGAAWTANGKYFGRYTWSQAGTSNNGRANAAAFCTGKGGTLARPNSQVEWTKLYQNTTADGYGYWMDGHNNFQCGTISTGQTKSYQYGLMYCPEGIGSMYTGCNCTASEQALVIYRTTSPGHFDGCQTGAFGVMDESPTYNHSAIVGFVCEK
jgi:hypothetical protein